ncbi:MAG TPA: hypothetical protein VES67_14025 [Vicinamibacterales bacterium]|nr:hypothetical protein [Vicinamibacterales bacterium]
MNTSTTTREAESVYLRSPAGRAAVAAEEKRKAAHRESRVQELLELGRQEALIDRKCLPELQLLQEHVEATEKAAQDARRTKIEKTVAYRASKAPISFRRLAVQRDLIASADPAIDDARRSMNELFETRRHGLANHEERKTGMLDGRIVRRSNGQAIRRLVEAINIARTGLEQLKLTAPANVEDAIALVMAPVNEAWARIGELDPWTTNGRG